VGRELLARSDKASKGLNALEQKDDAMKRSWSLVLLLLFLLAGGLTFAVNLYSDWLWFQELGKTVVFTTAIYAKCITGPRRS